MGDTASTSSSDGRRKAASAVRATLKRATADLHRSLETRLDLLGPDLSLGRYRRILEHFWGFYAPMEAGVAGVAGPGIGSQLRARTGLIERDLLSLGLSRHEVADLPRCAELPRLSSLEELAGCLYVLEGACLGGQVLAPVLQERLGVGSGTGASFFVGEADGTHARWGVFLAWLEHLVEAGAPEAQIAASARATFLAFARWVEQQQDLPTPARE